MAGNLTPKQGKVLACLLASPTVEAAASAAGVSRQTVYDYLAQTSFAEAYTDAITQAVESATAYLQASTAAAAGVLVQIMQDEGVNVNTRINAAVAVLNQAGKGVDLLRKSNDFALDQAIERLMKAK